MPENLRIRRSRILRAPQLVCSRFTFRTKFHLKGKLMSIAIGTAASISQPWNAALLVAVEYLVTGLARDAELPAELGHRLAS
jgi:hypothetical protein